MWLACNTISITASVCHQLHDKRNSQGVAHRRKKFNASIIPSHTLRRKRCPIHCERMLSTSKHPSPGCKPIDYQNYDSIPPRLRTLRLLRCLNNLHRLAVLSPLDLVDKPRLRNKARTLPSPVNLFVQLVDLLQTQSFGLVDKGPNKDDADEATGPMDVSEARFWWRLLTPTRKRPWRPCWRFLARRRPCKVWNTQSPS